jgi:hypothetical protein
MSWDCAYDRIDECQRTLVSGGWCSINPSWHPDTQQSERPPLRQTRYPLRRYRSPGRALNSRQLPRPIRAGQLGTPHVLNTVLR